MKVGSSKVVGRANENPIPRSHDTSTSSEPAGNSASSSSSTNINGLSVSCRTQLTTMSCWARNSAVDDVLVVDEHLGAARVVSATVEVVEHHGRDGGGHRRDVPHGEDGDVVDAERLKRGDRTAGSVAETDDRRLQLAPVVAGRPAEGEGVQDRAVPGHLVVEVEDVDDERAARRPVVHRLPGDEGESLVDGELGERRRPGRSAASPRAPDRREAPGCRPPSAWGAARCRSWR